MRTQADKTHALHASIRDGKPMTLREQLRLTVLLSIPAIIAQLSSIIMQYIDAAMVGHLGAEASASIGLVSTTTWLFWGLCVWRLPPGSPYRWRTESGRATYKGRVAFCGSH